MKSRWENLYLVLAILFSVVCIAANISMVKLISFPWIANLAIPCGVVVGPLVLFINHLITEIYGEARARFVIYMSLVAGFFFIGILQLALSLEPHSDWAVLSQRYYYGDTIAYQSSFVSIVKLAITALLSSVTAIAISLLLDTRLFGFIKELTKGKHLWMRSLGSTITSQVIETLATNILFLYCGLKMDLGVVIEICLICYLYKVLIFSCMNPLLYAAVSLTTKYISGTWKETTSSPLFTSLEPKTGMG